MISRERSVLLTIDDDKDWLYFIRKIMDGVEGVDLIEADTVYAGIGMVVAQPVDFVLLDKHFSLLNGQSIRAEKFLKDHQIEFVYLTARISDKELDKVRDRGCEVWSKDTPFDVLRHMICERISQIERTHAF